MLSLNSANENSANECLTLEKKKDWCLKCKQHTASLNLLIPSVTRVLRFTQCLFSLLKKIARLQVIQVAFSIIASHPRNFLIILLVVNLLFCLFVCLFVCNWLTLPFLSLVPCHYASRWTKPRAEVSSKELFSLPCVIQFFWWL